MGRTYFDVQVRRAPRAMPTLCPIDVAFAAAESVRLPPSWLRGVDIGGALEPNFAHKNEQEDRCIAIRHFAGRRDHLFLAVFDGHQVRKAI